MLLNGPTHRRVVLRVILGMRFKCNSNEERRVLKGLENSSTVLTLL